MRRWLAVHVALFALAFVSFYTGLAVGLLGVLVWLAAGAIAAADLCWLARRFSRR